MADIVISEFMDEGAVATLSGRFQTHYDPGLVDRPGDLAETVATAKALIVRNRTPVHGALLDAAPELQCVGRLGVGLDNIEGIGFVILVPAYQTFTEHRGLLLDFARRTDTIVVDLDSMLPRGGPMRARLFHEDGVHPTGALHAQFADQIRRTLDEEASKLGLTACLSDP